jgi:hypothetical protein
MNACVELRFTLNLPQHVLERLVGRSDDGSDEWHEEAGAAAVEAVENDWYEFIDCAGPPHVECLA